MPSSQLSSFVSDRKTTWCHLITWVARLMVGCLFVYSGFVKGIDVWGTVYKLYEYQSVIGIAVWQNLTVTAVFALCTVEFMIGIFMLFGCYRRSGAILAFAFMCFMLPLSLWIAVADPVADCGCFGDALIISNWATFWKNVVLILCTIWLLKHNTQIPCIITPAFQWMAFLATGIYLVAICWYGYMIQPMIDFRPFKAGTSIIAEESDEYEPEYLFVYQKDGKQQEFRSDNIPSEEEGWSFVSRREISKPEKTSGEKHDFRVMDKNGTEDLTEDAFQEEGKEFLLLIPSLRDISASTTYKINLLYDWAEAHDIRMAAVVAANTGNIPEWEDLSMPRYDIYTSDDTSIKELARGNPSVVYLDNGIIKWKSTLWALDDARFSEKNMKSDIDSWVSDGFNTLKNMTWIYIAVMAVLVCISFIPRLTKLFRPLGYKKVSHDDKAPREVSSSPDKSALQKTDEPSHD